MNATGVAILLLAAVAVTPVTRYVHKGVVGTVHRAMGLRDATFGDKPYGRWLRDQRYVAWIWRPGPELPSAMRDLVPHLLALRAAYGRALAVYVPISNSDYWDIYEDCPSKPLLIPALTGVPLLDGMPPLACRNALALYGSHVYEDYPARASDREADRETLCRTAREKGFRVVFRYAGSRQPGKNELIHCDEVTR
jgi:hypothetical protein